MFNKYPYTDFHELNLDWILTKITEFESEVKSLESTILDQANTYTDSAIQLRLANVEYQYNLFKNEVNNTLIQLNYEFDEFKGLVNARLNITDANIRAISSKVDGVLAQANNYTNMAINNNNAYIINEAAKAMSNATVLNPFTGEKISIQAMFDYLSQFHFNNAITVAELVERAKSVNTLISLNMNMTDLATNGKSLIPE